MTSTRPAVAAVFEPVQAPTTFEETVERLGTAIRIGLLQSGDQLPPERELAEQLSISRSTLRQALTALVESGHLVAQRGRGGGTFVAQCPPLAVDPPVELGSGHWRELLDLRIAIECGSALLASERRTPDDLERLERCVKEMDRHGDFAEYRRADVRFHLGLAEAARSPRLVASMTEVQGAMTELIAHIAHPLHVLQHSNAQHRRILVAVEGRDGDSAVRLLREHMRGTEKILAGLLPAARSEPPGAYSRSKPR